MKKQKVTLIKKKLVLAMSLTMAGALTGCSSGGGGGGDSIFSILLNGGLGGNVSPANGGNGGEISINNNGTSGGVKVKEKGAANTDFNSPIDPDDPDLGANPLAITADTTLAGVDDENPVANGAGVFTTGDLYLGDDDVIRQSAAGGAANFTNDAELATGSGYLRESDETIGIVDTATAATHSTATGLSVAEGVTLTLGNNDGSSTDVNVINDIDNNGTITREADGNNITLRSNTYFGGNITNAGTEDNETAGRITVRTATGISNDGSINASGFNEDDEDGGNGDRVQLSAGGYIINNGTINVSGGDGSGAGGDGAEVDVTAAYTENNGAIDSSGGSNISDPFVAGDGGDGGEIDMTSRFGTNNTAALDVSGGEGSQGGDGGEIDLRTYELGHTRNAAAMSLNGGAGVEGEGGDGGDFTLSASGGDALNSGAVSSMGGSTIFADANGGDGGEIIFQGNGGEGATPPGNVEVSGDLNVKGGDALLVADNAGSTGGGSGGDGGEISITLSVGDVYDDQSISLLGYMSMSSNGGDGLDGGNGGEYEFRADSRLNEVSQEYTVGSVTNEVALNALGGHSIMVVDGDTGNGGNGGEVDILTSTNDELVDLKAEALNEGVVVLTGGNATGGTAEGQDGGDGGRLIMSSFHGSENKGAVTSTGGDGGESGGNGGFVDITSQQNTAKNSADLVFGGGNGGEQGGYGGFAFIDGEKGDNSGDITANGGNATDDVDTSPNAVGGNGGEINITGHGLDGAKNSGDTSLLPGTGVEDGEAGCLQVGITFEGNCS